MSEKQQFSEDESFKLSLIDRYEDLELIGPDVEDFQCVKCQDIAILFNLTNCGHLLCKECQAKLMSRTNQKCPKCKANLINLSSKESEEFKIITNRINQLVIKCLNHQFGCNYQNELSKMESHMKTCLCSSTNEVRNMKTCLCSTADEEQINDKDEIKFTDSEINPDDITEANETEIPNVNEIEDPKQLNILLIGATGTGKSTFINAFANYLKYETWEEALAFDLEVKIPCKFNIWDGIKKKTIQLGADDSNENLQSGESSTQRCNIYEFQYEGHTIRFFDTPGVGDTRGLNQDKINLDKTLDVLANFEWFHGIFIFLRPDEKRLTSTFEYCIKQLLCQLPRKVMDNIVFMFTHARNTNYALGETVDLLNTIFDRIKTQPPFIDVPINENNMFFLDNEAFKFIAAVKNDITFTLQWQKINGKSWKHSRKQCKNLMTYVLSNCSETPSDIGETRCINRVRKAISVLTKPLAVAVQNIQDNAQVLRQQIKNIRKYETEGDARKLKESMYIPILKLKYKELETPRTVCQSKKCTKEYPVRHVTNTYFPQICCQTCNCEKVPRNGEVINDSIRFCEAFDKKTGYCLKCKCPFHQHKRIYYESAMEEERMTDASTAYFWEIYKKKSVELVINTLKNREEKLRAEQEKLSRQTAKLFIFLKTPAILTYNDAFEKYVEEIIENKKISCLGQQQLDVIRSLEEVKTNYIKEKELMEKSIAAHPNEEVVSINDALQTIEELFAMETSGEVLAMATKAYLYEEMEKVEFSQKSQVLLLFGAIGMLTSANIAAVTVLPLLAGYKTYKAFRYFSKKDENI